MAVSEKRALACSLGADIAIEPTLEELTENLLKANGGREIDLILEMTGGVVFEQSLAALAPFGRLVAYGQASDQGNQISSDALMDFSRTVAGFWLYHCFGHSALMDDVLTKLFQHVMNGTLRVVVGATYPLTQVAQAHHDLETRQTVGKLLLDVSC